MVVHDAGLEAMTNGIHLGDMSRDLAEEEVFEIDRVVVPLGPILPFTALLAKFSNGA